MIGTHTRWSTASSLRISQSAMLENRYGFETHDSVCRLYNDPCWLSQRQPLRRRMLDAYPHAGPFLRWRITSYQTSLGIALWGFGGYVVFCHACVKVEDTVRRE